MAETLETERGICPRKWELARSGLAPGQTMDDIKRVDLFCDPDCRGAEMVAPSLLGLRLPGFPEHPECPRYVVPTERFIVDTLQTS